MRSEARGAAKDKHAEFRKLRTLGRPGAQGVVFLVEDTSTQETWAMKQFKPKKSKKKVLLEAEFQERAAEIGVAPAVRAVLADTTPPCLVMAAMNRTLEQVLAAQDGQLTPSQQENIIETCEKLDAAGIYHNDPNPLNLMEGPDGDFFWIDYGFSKNIDPKKNGKHPNMRALNTVLHGGMQGLVTRKKWTAGYSIIECAVESVR